MQGWGRRAEVRGSCRPSARAAGGTRRAHVLYVYNRYTRTCIHTRWMKLSSLQEDAGALSSPDTRGKLALGSVFSSARPLRKNGKAKPSHPFGAGAAQRSGSSLSSPQPLSSRIAPSPRRTAPFWVRGFLRGSVGSAPPARPRRAARERQEPPHTPLSWSASAANPHKSPVLEESRPPPPQTAQVWPGRFARAEVGMALGMVFLQLWWLLFPREFARLFQAPAPAGLEAAELRGTSSNTGGFTRQEHPRGETHSLKTALNAISSLTEAR